jgi:hypothetical protein
MGEEGRKILGGGGDSHESKNRRGNGLFETILSIIGNFQFTFFFSKCVCVYKLVLLRTCFDIVTLFLFFFVSEMNLTYCKAIHNIN